MGCACSLARSQDPFNRGDMGRAATLLSEGDQPDQERMAAILQLSVALSIMSTEHGRTEEDLARATVAARSQLTAADTMSFWCLQQNTKWSEEESALVCIASDAAGMPSRRIPLVDTAAPPVAACMTSTALESPPLIVHLDDPTARAQLEQYYGRGLESVMYVPLNARSASQTEEGDVRQLGLLELVKFASPHPIADGAEAFTIIMRRQLQQLGGHLATAIHSLRLADAEQQGERLLYRMLPRHIVTQLQKRTSDDFIVESCEHAFVLYCDIVSFTTYCSGREPRDVVVMLNSMFATFDALLSKYNVHKVTTIGDAYVAATGLPFMNSKAPVLDIIGFAIDMIAAVRAFITEDGQRMQIRVGIHVGGVAAGVVGIAMPRYCLFGDTVTIAEQLEEHSGSGRILISEAVHEELKAAKGPLLQMLAFEEVEEPLVLSANGGGSTAMKTFFVNTSVHQRRRQSLAFLEELSTAQYTYFKDRTTAEDPGGPLSDDKSTPPSRDRSKASSRSTSRAPSREGGTRRSEGGARRRRLSASAELLAGARTMGFFGGRDSPSPSSSTSAPLERFRGRHHSEMNMVEMRHVEGASSAANPASSLADSSDLEGPPRQRRTARFASFSHATSLLPMVPQADSDHGPSREATQQWKPYGSFRGNDEDQGGAAATGTDDEGAAVTSEAYVSRPRRPSFTELLTP